MERWEDGFYITAMAGSAGGSSLVVMSKGTPYTQQSYKVRERLKLATVKDLTCSPPISRIDKVPVTPSRQLRKDLHQILAGDSARRQCWCQIATAA